MRFDGTTLSYIIINLFNYYVVFVWCPCMAINVSVQYKGGFIIPDIILLIQCYYHRGTHLNAMKRFYFFCSLQSAPKRFDIFSPDRGMLRRSRCVQVFL